MIQIKAFILDFEKNMHICLLKRVSEYKINSYISDSGQRRATAGTEPHLTEASGLPPPGPDLLSASLPLSVK